jgi:hypothetical protein
VASSQLRHGTAQLSSYNARYSVRHTVIQFRTTMILIDTTTLQLVSKNGTDKPRYAILSHTWGSDEDEVSFQEYRKYLKYRDMLPEERPDFYDRVTARLGFAKITQAATEASERAIEYLWVDTCCIDKTSSAELSEAINSMYRWYCDAIVCFAFLGDTTWQPRRPDMETTPPESSEDIYAALTPCKWFTRGWTLQASLTSQSDFLHTTLSSR